MYLDSIETVGTGGVETSWISEQAINAFVAGFIASALSRTFGNLDVSPSECPWIGSDCRAQMREECEKFIHCNFRNIVGMDPWTCGDEFWLARNGLRGKWAEWGQGDEESCYSELVRACEALGPCSLCYLDSGQYGIAVYESA